MMRVKSTAEFSETVNELVELGLNVLMEVRILEVLVQLLKCMEQVFENVLDIVGEVGVHDTRSHLAKLLLEQMGLVLSVLDMRQDLFIVELILMKRGLEVIPVVRVQCLPFGSVRGDGVLDFMPERANVASKHRHHALELRVLVQVLREEVQSVGLQCI